MSQFNPTQQQKDAINFSGSMVITACPGSGKTTVMKEKIRNITSYLPNHKGVIAITFTRKASHALKVHCKKNAHDTKQSFFGTIDSFCLKELILPFVSRVWGGNPQTHKVIKMLKEPYKHYIKEQYSSPTIENIKEDGGFKKLYDEGFLWMNSFAALAMHILNESSAAQRYIKARYSHIFIDEYQDSSAAQHLLFLKLYELGLTATAVGDTYQSIYEFRGGNSELLNSLVRDSERFNHFKIDINHRCHPSIVNYASRLLNPSFPLLPCEESDIFVYRRTLSGGLESVGKTISSWISTWLASGQTKKASDIAILAKKDKSLKLLVRGISSNYRLYTENPFDHIDSECSQLYSDLLAYRYGLIGTVQEVIDKQFDLILPKSTNTTHLRRHLKTLRNEQSIDELLAKFQNLAVTLGITHNQEADDALRATLADPLYVNQFMPLIDSEIQIMTLHKAKGLEFKTVFHIDLEEWSFPHRIPTQNGEPPNYPSLGQDTNLHYVGITRAEECCILIQAAYRLNSQGNLSRSTPSYFFSLPQLTGLFR